VNTIRLLLVHDNLLREGITSMLKKQPDLRVVSASRNCDQVLSKAQKFRPAVVVLEFGQHNTFGILEVLKTTIVEAKVIVTGGVALQANILELVKRGVSGFVVKEATFCNLVKTIRSVAGGAKVLPPALTASLFSQVVEHRCATNGLPTMDTRVTRREHEIINLISEGMSNKEISQRLHIATHTVKSHVHNVLEKLAVRNRLQLLAYTQRAGAFKNFQ
jgi:DNA-binding NarL/FixJ family response regulator